MGLGSSSVYAYDDGIKGWADGGNRVDRSDSSDHKMT
jgi:hypothetical protein